MATWKMVRSLKLYIVLMWTVQGLINFCIMENGENTKYMHFVCLLKWKRLNPVISLFFCFTTLITPRWNVCLCITSTDPSPGPRKTRRPIAIEAINKYINNNNFCKLGVEIWYFRTPYSPESNWLIKILA